MSEETAVAETKKRAAKVPVHVYKTEQEALDGEKALDVNRRLYKVTVMGETRFVGCPTPVLAQGFAVRDIAGSQITMEQVGGKTPASPVEKKAAKAAKDMTPEELKQYIAELQAKLPAA